VITDDEQVFVCVVFAIQ